MSDIFEVEIDGFEIQVETFIEIHSKEIEIINILDMEDIPLDNEFYEFFISEYYDEILEGILNQVLVEGEI